jgi:DNA-binding response OmpR family regulator
MGNNIPKNPPEAGRTEGGKKIVVLVAEDDTFLAKVHNKKLAKEGFEVRMAGNGEEALSLARKEKPDIILLDLIMPVKDGFQALAELKADPNLKDVKVIVLSNLSQEEDKERVLGMGAVEYVVKANISFRDVINVINKHLGLVPQNFEQSLQTNKNNQA